jgi:predicted enzyme related to lactoylglutathione lyase
MITGTHVLMWSTDADSLRAFFRDVVGLRPDDPTSEWACFELPAAELAMHPGREKADSVELYLTCDDIAATVAELAGRGAELVKPPSDEGFGTIAYFLLPDGAKLGIYEPRQAPAADAESTE